MNLDSMLYTLDAMPAMAEEWDGVGNFTAWVTETPVARRLAGDGWRTMNIFDALDALGARLGDEENRIACAVHPETKRVILLVLSVDGTRAAVVGEVTSC